MVDSLADEYSGNNRGVLVERLAAWISSRRGSASRRQDAADNQPLLLEEQPVGHAGRAVQGARPGNVRGRLSLTMLKERRIANANLSTVVAIKDCP